MADAIAETVTEFFITIGHLPTWPFDRGAGQNRQAVAIEGKLPIVDHEDDSAQSPPYVEACTLDCVPMPTDFIQVRLNVARTLLHRRRLRNNFAAFRPGQTINGGDLLSVSTGASRSVHHDNLLHGRHSLRVDCREYGDLRRGPGHPRRR
jgi:hypothetical protein